MFKTLKIYCRADIVFCLVPDTGLISLNDIATSLWHSVHVLNQYHWLICVLLLFHVYHTEQGFIWYPTLGKLNLLVMIADCNGIPLHVKWLLSHYLASIYPNKKRYIYLIYHSIICVLLWLHVYHTEQGFMWYSPVRKLSLPAMIADHNVTPLLVKWLLYHLLAYCLLKIILQIPPVYGSRWPQALHTRTLQYDKYYIVLQSEWSACVVPVPLAVMWASIEPTAWWAPLHCVLF